MENEACCNNTQNGLSFLSNTATKEMEVILKEELCILFAIDIKGNIKRVYPNHFDQSKINVLHDKNSTTSLVIKTRIPKCEIEEEKNFLKKCFSPLTALRCCCLSGGRCKSCP